ncbi:hypothetical protein VTK73DRAFT_9610 [Phialemonium thermophilum]|uniref:Uncharacterized protein n=1 Tax=Phialemonium thermophilum TaxID=223376 RepID=A0ABR3XKV4_9PEZI
MASIDDLDHVGFLSLSVLLCLRQGRQEPEGGEVAGDDRLGEDSDVDAASVHDSVTPQADSDSELASAEKQLVQFLDHVAETFAREKNDPTSRARRHERRRGASHDRAANHVAAAGLVMVGPEPRVCIAKNGGVDDADRDLARTLTVWMRTIAVTGQRPAMDRDIAWARLVDSSRQRLDVYATRIRAHAQEALVAAFSADQSAAAAVLAEELYSLSAQYQADRSIGLLKRMVSAAYGLRYEAAPAGLSDHGRRVRRDVFFLGRLRAAYEVFKETAIELRKSFARISFACCEAPPPGTLVRNQCERRIEALAAQLGIARPGRERLRKVLGKGGAQVLLPCHAEMQLLLHFETTVPADADPFPYLGCSKKSCWLCYRLLTSYQAKRTASKGFYQTRGSHGRLYPLWHVPMEPDPRVEFYLSTALHDTMDLMTERLRVVAPVRRPLAAESTAHVSVAGGPLRRRALAEQRAIEAAGPPRQDGAASADSTSGAGAAFADFVGSRRCLRIPASGEAPHLVTVHFYKPAAHGYPASEPATFHVPDLAAYWNASNLNRAYRRVTFTNQDPPEVDGDYLLYWCRDGALPPNRGLMDLLQIPSLDLQEHFFYGDVFLTRFHEDEKTFEFSCRDVPAACVGPRLALTNFVRALWKRREPEQEFRIRQELGAQEEKTRADKELLLERMTPNERERVKRVPGLLDFLALSSCDDGALLDVALDRSPATPGFVSVETRWRPTAVEKRGWKGFSSNDL